MRDEETPAEAPGWPSERLPVFAVADVPLAYLAIAGYQAILMAGEASSGCSSILALVPGFLVAPIAGCAMLWRGPDALRAGVAILRLLTIAALGQVVLIAGGVAGPDLPNAGPVIAVFSVVLAGLLALVRARAYCSGRAVVSAAIVLLAGLCVVGIRAAAGALDYTQVPPTDPRADTLPCPEGPRSARQFMYVGVFLGSWAPAACMLWPAARRRLTRDVN